MACGITRRSRANFPPPFSFAPLFLSSLHGSIIPQEEKSRQRISAKIAADTIDSAHYTGRHVAKYQGRERNRDQVVGKLIF